MKIEGSLRTESALLINIIYSIHVLSRRKIPRESQQGIYLRAEMEMAPDTIGHVLLKTLLRKSGVQQFIEFIVSYL